MVIVRVLNNYRLYLGRNNSLKCIEKLSSSIYSVRYCSSVLEDTRTYQLGDFQNDLKPFLKTRKKNSFYDRPQKLHRDEEPTIKCKNEYNNHYRMQTYDKFKPVPLASENWLSHKSVGDHFTISIYTKDYELPDCPKVKFEDSNIQKSITDILTEHGITVMSPVQESALSKIAEGYNTLIAAETGCGKTLAYLVPIIEQILESKKNQEDRYNAPFVIILTPSRELTYQIQSVIKWFTPLNIKSHKLIGGSFAKKVFNPNVDDIDFLVSTVGTISKFVATGVYSLTNVRHVILDEADALLDDSFNENTLRFLNKFKFRAGPSEKNRNGVQLTLASATMPTSLSDLLGNIVEVDFFEKITSPNLHRTMPHVPQKFLRVNRSTKPAYLLQIVKADYQSKRPVIIFCNTSSTCNWLSSFLSDNNIKNINLNGDMNWKLRRGRFQQFQDGDVNVLVCTSLAARGLDTHRVQHVVNYELPSFISDYIHRCGRTGRLGSKTPGKITNIVSSRNEIEIVQKIEKSVRLMSEFENVNPNIKRIIRFRGGSAFDNQLGIDKFEVDDERNYDDDEGDSVK